MKIIQIIKDGNKLLGLGDDGYTYVYSKLKYSFWNDKLNKETVTNDNVWIRVANRHHEAIEGINFIASDGSQHSRECDYEEVISSDLNYKF